MSAPKHLWSGDWEHESDAASDERADRRPAPTETELTASPAPARARRGPRRRRRPKRRPTIVIVALLAIVAVAWGLTSLLTTSSTHPATTPSAQALPPARTTPFQPQSPTPIPTPAPAATTPTPTTPAAPLPAPVYWLGMEIQTVPPGAAVIDTVGPGTQGEIAGLEPGDEIVAVNHHQIYRTADINAAIRGLAPGDVVAVRISHGSALYGTEVTLGAKPALKQP